MKRLLAAFGLVILAGGPAQAETYTPGPAISGQTATALWWDGAASNYCQCGESRPR